MREQYHRSRALRTREQGVHIPHHEGVQRIVDGMGCASEGRTEFLSCLCLTRLLIIDRGEAVNELKDEGKLLCGVR